MTQRRRRGVDPVEREIALALAPGRFIPDRACFSFVSGLDEVAAAIANLISTEPVRAVRLYETFLAGCYEKAEELDDSSGSFGQFVKDLYCGWIQARQAAGADPEETATRLLVFMDRDQYGFSYRLERAATKAFNKFGLAAFERQVRTRFEAAATAQPSSDALGRGHADYAGRHWGEVLRSLYLAQKNVAASRHDRKSGFMSGFERLLAGRRPYSP